MSDTPEQLATKLAALRTIHAPKVAELVRVGWPEPDGPIYYGMKSAAVRDILDNQTLLDQLDGPIELRFDQSFFLDIPQTQGISDDKVDLDFWDGDDRQNGEVFRSHEISRLFHTHGAGVKVEIFYYFPEVDLLLLQWWGHLQPPSDVALERFKTSAEFGFLSALLPLPRRAFFSSCSALFGGLLATQEQIDRNDCPYSLHIGGDTGEIDPDTSEPFTSCPRNNRAVCIARLGDDKSYLGFDTVIESYTVGQSKGPNINVTTRGNSNNLKRPLRVVFGERHLQDLDLLAYSIEPDTKHPEGGAVTCLFAECEGPINGQNQQKINGNLVGYMHLNVRNGELRQSRTGFSKNVSNYSGTALFFGRVQGDFTQITADQLRGEVTVQGLRDVRVYSDADTFTLQYTTDRAWALFRMLTDKRWGYGLDESRIVIQDFIDLSAWYAETVTVHDDAGEPTTSERSTFNAELIDRTAQQQITDVCLAGRCSVPFADATGQIRIKPLRKVSDEDLAAAPVFTDYGNDRNIVVDDRGVTTLTHSIQDDKTLCNRIVLTYDDVEHGNSGVPLVFEDETQQLAAGATFGDFTRRAVEKSYTAFGVTALGEAGRLGNLLLDLGEFDEGGLRNNLRFEFTTWFAHALTVLKYDVIRIRSRKLDLINDWRVARGEALGVEVERFEYFRVRSKRRLPDLKVEISAQAYPVAYYEALESAEIPPPIVPAVLDANPGGGGGRLPFDVDFDEVNHSFDRISFKLAL